MLKIDRKLTPRIKLTSEGFTLVELLIVIVIIGILAGVVIGVLNPIQQQNRARDASARSQVDKLALSTKSLMVSSPRTTNRVPTPQEFAAGVGNYVGNGTSPCTGTDVTADALCTFSISGIALPATCGAADGYNGAATGQCAYGFYRSTSAAASQVFRIAAKGAATPQVLFVYEYNENLTTGTVTEGFYSCANVSHNIQTTTAVGNCTLL